METMRESWTDARLDDFRAETSRRFDTLERRMDDGFTRLDARIDDLHHLIHRTMLQLGAGLIVTLVVGFASLIATQL
jgi:hypothetical protein